MRRDCVNFKSSETVQKKKGCKCKKNRETVTVEYVKCSKLGPVTSKFCDGCKHYKKK